MSIEQNARRYMALRSRHPSRLFRMLTGKTLGCVSRPAELDQAVDDLIDGSPTNVNVEVPDDFPTLRTIEVELIGFREIDMMAGFLRVVEAFPGHSSLEVARAATWLKARYEGKS